MGERLQRCADDRAARTENRPDLVLGKPRAWGQPMVDDGGKQRRVDLPDAGAAQHRFPAVRQVDNGGTGIGNRHA
jgi:hypothetical protein